MSKTGMTELCSHPAMKLAYLNTQNLNPSILISSTTNHSLLDSTWSQYFGYDNRPTLLWLTGPSLFLSHAAQLLRTKTAKWKEQQKLPLQHETWPSYFSIYWRCQRILVKYTDKRNGPNQKIKDLTSVHSSP